MSAPTRGFGGRNRQWLVLGAVICVATISLLPMFSPFSIEPFPSTTPMQPQAPSEALSIPTPVSSNKHTQSSAEAVSRLFKMDTTTSTALPRRLFAPSTRALASIILNEQTDRSSSDSSARATTSISEIPSLPHPSCLAEYVIRLLLASQAVPRPRPFPSKAPAQPAGKKRVAQAAAEGRSVSDNPLPADVSEWHRYSKPDYQCFKHGGHSPGLPRRGPAASREGSELQAKTHLLGDVAARRRPIGSFQNHIELSNVVYHKGTLYGFDFQDGARSKHGKKVTIHYGASFSMVNGNWPQPVHSNITLETIVNRNGREGARPLEAFLDDILRLPERAREGNIENISNVVMINGAYWQPPTDFSSQYHTLVEQVGPMFHSVLSFAERIKSAGVAVSRENNDPVAVNTLPPMTLITSRPRQSPWSKVFLRKKNSCHYPPEVADGIVGGASFREGLRRADKESYTSPAGATHPLAGHCMLSMLGRMSLAVAGRNAHGGTYGLLEHHSQFADPANAGSPASLRPWKYDTDLKERYRAPAISDPLQIPLSSLAFRADDVLVIGKLLVGNPTQCEPLWGPDPFYAEALAQDQFLRGTDFTIFLLDTSTLSPLQQGLAGSRLRAGVGGSTFAYSQDALPKEHVSELSELMRTFWKSYHACQRFMWEFRNFFIREALQSNQTVSGMNKSEPRVKTSTSSFIIPNFLSEAVNMWRENVRIVFASRKGDWARQLSNEDAVIDAIRRHLAGRASLLGQILREKTRVVDNSNSSFLRRLEAASSNRASPDSTSSLDAGNPNPCQVLQRAYSEATIDVVRFTASGLLEGQLEDELRVRRTTIFIGNHGANLIPSVFLRPNSGLITLSFATPGFYPFSVVPRWVHWRDLQTEQDCNRRLQKGRCRWSSGNNNDMIVTTPHQMARLLDLLDDVIVEQLLAPRAALLA